MKSPVLFIIFKRADTTKRVFERIREAQPPRLYIAADGPRKDRPDEVEKCKAARKVVEVIDWPCEVHRLYRDENMGCGKGVSSAITWFFEHEEQGIIIEDDILPHIDFFKYCDEMLERYKNDERIHLISGFNFFYDGYNSDASCYLSDFGSIWGWASWRRVWVTYLYDVNDYPEKELLKKIYDKFPIRTAKYYHKIFEKMKKHKVDTWDSQFAMNRFFYGRCSIVPYVNMVENIGFGGDGATHTSVNVKAAYHKAGSIYPLKSIDVIKYDKQADQIAISNGGMYVRPLPIDVIHRIIGRIKKEWSEILSL